MTTKGWILGLLFLNIYFRHFILANPANPSGQPTSQPSTQPSSTPTQAGSGGVFIIPVTDHADISFDYSSQINPCSATHWIQQPSTTCTLRAALAFCIHNVPWDSSSSANHISPKECVVKLNRNVHGGTIHLTQGAITLPEKNIKANVSINVLGDGVKVTSIANGKNAFMFKQKRISSAHSVQNGVHLHMYNITFDSIKTLGSASPYGGAVMIDGFASVKLKDVIFTDNNGELGGAMHVSNTSYVAVIGVHFSRNQGVAGGSIFAQNVDAIQISDSLFTDGSASTVGGAVTLESCGSALITRCSLTNNKADYHGGAIAAHNIFTNLALSHTNVSGNSAPYGPSLCMRHSKNVVIDSSKFIGNVAGISATVHWIRDDLHPVRMSPPLVHTNNIFQGNYYGASMVDTRNLTTEVTRLTTYPTSLHLTDYVNDDSLQLHVSLFDFYGHALELEVASLELTVKAEHAAGCSYNKERSKITGSALTTSVHAAAHFDGFGVRCIPGGQLNMSVVPAFSIAATNFPLYNVPDMARLALFSSSKRKFEGLVPVTLRQCQVGEYFDFDDAMGRSACKVCQSGYSIKNNTRNEIISCETCPANSNSCYSDKVVLTQGTWRYSKESTKVFFCPMPEGCLGGESYGQHACGLGYKGPLCATCSDDYVLAPDRYSCQPCKEAVVTPSAQLLIPFALLFVLFFGAIVYYWIKLHHHHMLLRKVHPLKQASSEAILDMQLKMQAQERWFEVWMQNSPRIKIFLTSYQIVVLLPECLRMQRVGPLMGKHFASFVNFMAWVNFDTLRAMPIACYRAWNYIDSMVAITSIPVAVTICLVVAYFIYFRYYIYHYKPSNMYPQDNLQAYFKQIPILSEVAEHEFEEEVRLIKHALFSRYVFIAVLCSYVVVPSVLLNVLNLFDCVDLDPLKENPEALKSGSTAPSSQFMKIDMSVNCNSDEYFRGRRFVVAMCVIYPVVFSVMYTSLYHRAQKFAHMVVDEDVSKTDIKKLSAPIRFLFSESYKPGYYFWEFVDIFKRLLLMVVLAFVNAGTQLQIVWGLMWTLALYKMQCHYKPYKNDLDNTWAEAGYAQIFCTLFCFLIYRSQAFDAKPELYEVLDFCMLKVNFVFFALVAWELVQPYFQTACVKLGTWFKAARARARSKVGPNIESSNARKLSKPVTAASAETGETRVNTHAFAAENKSNIGATLASKQFVGSDDRNSAALAQSLVQSAVAEAMFQPIFRKSKAQQKHWQRKGIRQKEIVFMKNNFKDILQTLQKPGNSLVKVLDLGDPAVSMDDINSHKLHLEDSLTAAENVLTQERAQREKVLIECGLPYNSLGNIGDVTRVDKYDRRYFHAEAWLPPAFALSDNRLNRSCLRVPEVVNHNEATDFIRIDPLEAAEALAALEHTYDISDDESSSGIVTMLEDGNSSEGSSSPKVADEKSAKVDLAQKRAVMISPMSVTSASSELDSPDKQFKADTNSSPSRSPSKHIEYTVSSSDTESDYALNIRAPVTTQNFSSYEMSTDSGSNSESES